MYSYLQRFKINALPAPGSCGYRVYLINGGAFNLADLKKLKPAVADGLKQYERLCQCVGGEHGHLLDPMASSQLFTPSTRATFRAG